MNLIDTIISLLLCHHPKFGELYISDACQHCSKSRRNPHKTGNGKPVYFKIEGYPKETWTISVSNQSKSRLQGFTSLKKVEDLFSKCQEIKESLGLCEKCPFSQCCDRPFERLEELWKENEPKLLKEMVYMTGILYALTIQGVQDFYSVNGFRFYKYMSYYEHSSYLVESIDESKGVNLNISEPIDETIMQSDYDFWEVHCTNNRNLSKSLIYLLCNISSDVKGYQQYPYIKSFTEKYTFKKLLSVFYEQMGSSFFPECIAVMIFDYYRFPNEET
jgi:hypothetical protein